MTCFLVPQALLDELYAHCEAAYPEEGCGLLLGPADAESTVTRVMGCANIQNRLHAEDPQAHPRDARTAYLIDPKDLFQATREARDSSQKMVGIFHSHADVGAYFSDEDQRQAAPEMTLSAAAFGRSTGLSEAVVLQRLKTGQLAGDAAQGQVTAAMPSYPELIYLVVDVRDGHARGVRGYRWNETAQRHVEVNVQSENGRLLAPA